MTSNSALRFQYHAALDNVKEEWKQLETVDLLDLQRRQDQTNRALSDAKFWAKKDPAKSADYELKYKTGVVEWVTQIHQSRMKKEELIPQWVLRCAQAEVPPRPPHGPPHPLGLVSKGLPAAGREVGGRYPGHGSSHPHPCP